MATETAPVVAGAELTRSFRSRSRLAGRVGVRALAGVDVVVRPGSSLCLIGESGCGKTTLGRVLCGMETVDGGELTVGGSAVRKPRPATFRRIQMVHQDPYSALNPTRTITQAMNAGLATRAQELGKGRPWMKQRRDELLTLVGLDPGQVGARYPHQLSGGQRQRVVIARALTVDPDVLVADEAVSMIDVSLRLGILGLLARLRREAGLALVFVSHDVAAARYVGADGELCVLYRGQVVERGPTEEVISAPLHPYTQCLLSAIPVMHGLEQPGPERVLPTGPLEGAGPAQGCRFADRCPFAEDRCRTETQTLAAHGGPGHQVACWKPTSRQVVARRL